MCGILGVIPGMDHAKFSGALNLLQHRGPDGSGIISSESDSITLGHRRLAIIDLTDRGQQPMLFEHHMITFNGEIYNYLEIREELKRMGIQFTTETDTEVVLKAFLKWGPKCLDRFNGMWAFAIWNERERTLFLSRDRFGKKPLFYTFSKNRFVFGSEMKALMPFLEKIEVSDEFDYCKNNVFRYENTSICLIKGIHRFPKGCFSYYRYGENSVKTTKFWETRDHLHKVPKKYEDQVQEFKELFLDACKIRMRSDVAFGTALSGGLDSSATICAMAHVNKNMKESRFSNDWQNAFIASFSGTSLDETKFAKKVVENLQIPGHFIDIDPVSGIRKVSDYLFYQEELYLTSPIPMIDLYGLVRQKNVFVTLDGHGADELFSGYADDLLLALLDAGWNSKRRNEVINAYKDMFPNRSTLPSDFFTSYIRKKHQGRFNVFKSNLARLIIPKHFEDPSNGKLGSLNEHLYHIFHETVLPTLLRNYDRYSMANGVEIRMPFMDHRLVTYSFSLPYSSKIKKGYTKSIIRDALEDIMPSDIVRRKDKIGFNTPIIEWVKKDWREFFLDTVNSVEFNNSERTNSLKVKNQLNRILNESNVEFWEGQELWNEFQPYFWEIGFLKNDNILKAKAIVDG